MKDPTKSIKNQSNDWEIIFASHSSDKGLVFRLENSELNSKNKANKSKLKLAKDMHRISPKRIQR